MTNSFMVQLYQIPKLECQFVINTIAVRGVRNRLMPLTKHLKRSLIRSGCKILNMAVEVLHTST